MLNITKQNSNKDSLRINLKRNEKDKNNISSNNNIFKIIENNNLEKLLILLKSDHSKINAFNNDGLAPIHLSVMKGNLDITYHLLLNGANPNITSSSKKQTPLHLAYIYQNSKTDLIIKNLKKFKANENIYDIYYKKPIDYSNKKGNNSGKENKNNNNKSNEGESITKNHKRIYNKNNKIPKNVKNVKENIKINKFSKIDFNIKGDIDNVENDDNEICDNDSYNNDTYNDIISNSLDDSLEMTNKPKNKENKFKLKESSRNNLKTNKNNSTCIYRNSSGNDISYESKDKKQIKNAKKMIKNKSYKSVMSNKDGSIKIDEIFKDLIKKKRQSIGLKKNNSYSKNKKNIMTKGHKGNNRNKAQPEYNKQNQSIENTKINNIFNLKEKNININSIKTNSINNNNTGFLSAFSTENQTKNKNTKEKITIITNKDVVEFKYGDSFTEENNNTGKCSCNNSIPNNNSLNTNNIINNNVSFNVLNKEINTKETEHYTNILLTKNKNNNMTDLDATKSYPELKHWLDNIDLSMYLQNFIDNNIYDINILINQMKNTETKLGYDDIESILKIHKPGHIYRLFCYLEVSAGLFQENIAKFLIKINNNNKDKVKEYNSNKNNNKLKLSVSQEMSNCINCIKISFLPSQKKNDLKSFLGRYDLMGFYQNFYHNGFDLINFVMLQMFSSEPINEITLENCFHIYEHDQREQVLKCIISEKNKINYFLNSNEYINCEFHNIIKYEDIIFEENEDKGKEKIKIPNDNSCVECSIY